MITFLGYSVVYGLMGYLVFLKWIKMSPPREGEFEHSHNRYGVVLEGWYVPALIRSPEVYGSHRGMHLQYVMWMSITAWPIVFVEGIVLIISKIVRDGWSGIRNYGRNLSYSIAHFTLPLEESEEQPKDPEMIKAEREVEKICTW